VRRVDLIDRAIEDLLAQPEADSLRAVSAPLQTPYKMWRIENHFLKPIVTVPGMTESYCMPRQILPPVYWQNGYVDIVRARVVLEDRLMCGTKILPFLVDEPLLELDYPESIPIVEEALLKLRRGESINEGAQPERHPV
jgi:N-acylneuraminate cytidylyltransferase